MFCCSRVKRFHPTELSRISLVCKHHLRGDLLIVVLAGFWWKAFFNHQVHTSVGLATLLITRSAAVAVNTTKSRFFIPRVRTNGKQNFMKCNFDACNENFPSTFNEVLFAALQPFPSSVKSEMWRGERRKLVWRLPRFGVQLRNPIFYLFSLNYPNNQYL